MPRSEFWSAVFLKNSIKISLVVGTLLNAINQGSAFVGPETVSWLHVGLNYCVPFCVAYYSAWRNSIARSSQATDSEL